MTDLTQPREWRKSSRSGGNNGQCVEVVSGVRAVRDSKNQAVSFAVGVEAAEAFMASVKAGDFDR